MQVRRFRRDSGMALALAGALGWSLACAPTRGEGPFLVTPPQPAVSVGERMVLSVHALEEFSGDVEWEVMESSGGGLLQSRGPAVTYVAPSTAGTYHLRIRAERTGGGVVRQDLEVAVRPVARVEPPGATLPPGGTLQFSVKQRGLPRGTVTWSVEDAEGGTISPDGLYRAPAARGTYIVVATSTEDKSVVLFASVTVQ